MNFIYQGCGVNSPSSLILIFFIGMQQRKQKENMKRYASYEIEFEEYGTEWVKYGDVKDGIKELLSLLNNARGYCVDELGDDINNVLSKYKEFLE